MKEQEKYMLKAIHLALKGTGYVSPNPRVGCVIVKDKKEISQGWHKKFGAEHAEAMAIKKAKDSDLEGATLYVNLEPCSHQGKTPPCVDLIIEKKIATVVIGIEDPNPLVSGKGIEKLKEAGIEVITGILEKNSRWINRFFIKHITTNMPYVIVKIGISLDGCIAMKSGQSKWITSTESRERSHAIRAEVDAILVGKKTVMVDHPRLDARQVKGKNPKRIIFDTNLSNELSNPTFNDGDKSTTFICSSKSAAKTRKADNLKVCGINVLACNENDSGQIDIASTLKLLSEKQNVSSIMVEGGSEIISSFLDAGMIDELNLFIAPIIIGNGIKAFAHSNFKLLDKVPQMELVNTSQIGPDVHLIYVKKEKTVEN